MTDRTPQIAHADPWDAIIAELTARAAELPPPPIASTNARPTPVISRGRPFTARPDSIRCLKQRAIPHRRLYMVSFEDQQPAASQWRWLIGVDQTEAGWITRGGAGGGGDAPPARPPVDQPGRLVGHRSLLRRRRGPFRRQRRRSASDDRRRHHP